MPWDKHLRRYCFTNAAESSDACRSEPQFRFEYIPVEFSRFKFCALVPALWWRFGAVGSDVGQINEVTLRRARLALGWVSVSG